MPVPERHETELKPFGVEYLEEIVESRDLAFGSNKGCCNTFMSNLGPEADTGSMTCVDGVDDPC